MTVSAKVVTITPALASEMLKRNTHNRPIRPTAIERYAQDMQDGKWILNGEAIMQHEDGMLINGQTRLSACIVAGVPFETLLVQGLNGEARDTIDVGVPHTLSDALGWRGVPEAKLTAAATTWSMRYDEMVEADFNQLMGYRVSRQQYLDYFARYPQIADSAEFIAGIRRRLPGGKPSVAAFTHFLLARHADKGSADAFYTQVAEGAAEPTNPAGVLHEWLLDHQTLMSRKSPTVFAAMQIKAARFWIQGKSIKALSWKRTSTRKGERFPRIDQDLD